MMSRSPQKVRLPTEKGEITLATDSILWTEERGKNRNLLHTKTEPVMIYCAFVQLQRVLGEDFLFCLEHGLVNMTHILYPLDDGFMLDSGEWLRVDSYWLDKSRNRFCRWITQRVWEG